MAFQVLLSGYRPLPSVRDGVYRSLEVCPVDRYVSLRTALDGFRGGEAEPVFISAGKNDCLRLQVIQQNRAVGAPAPVMRGDE